VLDPAPLGSTDQKHCSILDMGTGLLITPSRKYNVTISLDAQDNRLETIHF